MTTKNKSCNSCEKLLEEFNKKKYINNKEDEQEINEILEDMSYKYKKYKNINTQENLQENLLEDTQDIQDQDILNKLIPIELYKELADNTIQTQTQEQEQEKFENLEKELLELNNLIKETISLIEQQDEPIQELKTVNLDTQNITDNSVNNLMKSEEIYNNYTYLRVAGGALLGGLIFTPAGSFFGAALYAGTLGAGSGALTAYFV